MKASRVKALPPARAESMGTKDCCERNEPEADLREQGLCPGDVRPNGLGRLSGGWSEKEFRDFERATAEFEEVDEQP